jgi:hypothetical protein
MEGCGQLQAPSLYPDAFTFAKSTGTLRNQKPGRAHTLAAIQTQLRGP